MKNIFGKSWHKVITTISNATCKIYEEGSKKGINFSDKSFHNYLDHELEGLNVYVAKASVAEYQGLSPDLLIQNKDNDWTKDALSFGTGATVGTLAGVGTSTVASSVFVQASLWTSIQGFFGVSTGVVVSASTYSLLTIAAPVGLGVLATVGIYSGLMDWKMLCTAWEIAIADGKIEDSELQLHNRMADKLGISRDEVKEIRRALNLKHEQELWEVAEVLESNGSKTKLLKSVREQYRLQPAAHIL
ncbi:MAG TPA: hypothetical protein DCE56_06775 [Cyanobacteria bacterium UBA8553]|nr:hypothetical protein [Cyanobacteria bacterium UBA8553]